MRASKSAPFDHLCKEMLLFLTAARPKWLLLPVVYESQYDNQNEYHYVNYYVSPYHLPGNYVFIFCRVQIYFILDDNDIVVPVWVM